MIIILNIFFLLFFFSLSLSSSSVQSIVGLFEIGRGSYGRVLLARHQQSQTPLAIKQPVMSEGHASPGELVEEIKATRIRSRKEALLHQLVSGHPFFPIFWGTLDAGNDICLALEFIGDTTTADSLSLYNAPPLSVRKALGIAQDIVKGLDFLHGHDILHNDLKSDNVLLKRQGRRLRAVIIDFGLASTVDHPTKLTTVPQALKEAYLRREEATYVAPEIILDGQLTSTASDVFSLGLIFLDIEKRVKGTSPSYIIIMSHITKKKKREKSCGVHKSRLD